MPLGSISFIQILFLQPTILYQTCNDQNRNECENHGWSLPGEVFDCSGNLIIGNFGGTKIVEKTFDLPPHKFIKFSVTIYKLDSWDMESFEISVNNELVYTISQGNSDGSRNLCKHPSYIDNTIYYEKIMTFPNDVFELVIKFQSHLDQDVDDESWGFRDFRLQIFTPCVNFYTECNYQGEMIQICQGDQTIYQQKIPFEIRSFRTNSKTIVKIRGSQFSSGNTQQYTSSQPCLDSFKFPKVEYVQ
ncbi:unnamed protein product [Paramecium sonneborni]|uniref:Galectin n=1 Tax=Paramecium sonneborni TaxID=65129 RepID=A0A8S1NM55_9CILI|nr:unnamed protein product [Paramecium sonneborni]